MNSSNNNRSSSSRPSRQAAQNNQSNRNTRTTSVPAHRDFTIMLTNNTTLLRSTRMFQPVLTDGINGRVTIENGIVHIRANSRQEHEQILHNTLAADLSDVAREYLARTRQRNPILYVFDMTGIDDDL